MLGWPAFLQNKEVSHYELLLRQLWNLQIWFSCVIKGHNQENAVNNFHNCGTTFNLLLKTRLRALWMWSLTSKGVVWGNGCPPPIQNQPTFPKKHPSIKAIFAKVKIKKPYAFSSENISFFLIIHWDLGSMQYTSNPKWGHLCWSQIKKQG